jgi:hypothetical protein
MSSAITTNASPALERDLKVEQAVNQLEKVNLDAQARRLEHLNDTMRDELQTSHLAHINVYGAFDPAEVERRATEEAMRQNSTLWSGLEWVRNVLVLVPITLTWVSFWLAAQDYGALLEAHPEMAGNSFLHLWETGFAGEAVLPFLTFSQTALIAAFLLMIILVLTVLVHYRKDVATTRATNEAVKIRTDLEEALWEIEKVLSSRRRSDSQVGVAEDLHQAVTQFNVITDRMGNAVTRMDGGAREWMNLTKDLDLRLGLVVTEMKDEADGLRVFSNGLTGNVDRMFGHLESATQTSAQLTYAIENLASSIQANTALQEDKLNDIASQLNVLEEQAKGWGQALLKSTDDLRLASDKSTTSVASVAGAVVTVTALLKGQDELRTTLLEAHKSSEEQRKWMEELVRGLQASNSGQGITNLAAQLKTSMDGLTRSNVEMAQEQINALNQIKSEISHTMRAFLNERANIMQTMDQQARVRERKAGGVAPAQFAPLALAVATGVLISSSIVAIAALVISRIAGP